MALRPLHLSSNAVGGRTGDAYEQGLVTGGGRPVSRCAVQLQPTDGRYRECGPSISKNAGDLDVCVKCPDF